VKKNLFAVMLVAAFSLSAMAASGAHMTANKAGNASASRSTAPTWGLPSVPATIVFYGGDINVNDPNANGFANANTIAVGQASTYPSVKAPAGSHVVVSGTFGNNSAFFGYFDGEGTYDVRTGVSEGVGGHSAINGTATETEVATGRDPFGLIEYTTSINFPHNLTATAGTTYWVNETPQCISNPNCENGEFYYLSNTTQETNGVNATAQVANQIYFNSSYFGYTWANWCDSSLGQNTEQCARMSFGLTR
jgi:hypothetical protein